MKGRESGMPIADAWDRFFDADCVLSRLDCAPEGGDVLEFGCGYGTFTQAAAKLTGGTVHAIDIDADMVAATDARMRDAGLGNVRLERRDFVADGCGLPDGAVRYALLFNILHIEEPVDLLREAYRVLSPGGTLGVIHWNHDPSTPRGPSMAIRPRPERCREWAETAGFAFVRFEPLTCCAHHYGIVFRRR